MNLSAWFVTLQIDTQRTRDITVHAHSAWHARWLTSITHPHHTILHVRPVRR